jgi:hypothetical protein
MLNSRLLSVLYVAWYTFFFFVVASRRWGEIVAISRGPSVNQITKLHQCTCKYLEYFFTVEDVKNLELNSSLILFSIFQKLLVLLVANIQETKLPELMNQQFKY